MKKYGAEQCCWHWNNKVKQNADENNLMFRGVQPKPRQFTPIINFQQDERGMGTDRPNKRKVAEISGGVGQPDNDIFSVGRGKSSVGR